MFVFMRRYTLKKLKICMVILMTGCGLIAEAAADLSVAPIFTDNMVLQRNMPIPVWGRAKPGENVEVRFNGQHKSVMTGTDGCWKVVLEPLAASSKSEILTIATGRESLTLKNVLVGEVWLCSGQSNMEWPVQKALNANIELSQADNPLIRIFDMPRQPSAFPQKDVPRVTDWKVCSPENIKDFSAVGYFFGRDLQKDLNVPIGLIDSSWGGTMAESWISAEALGIIPETQKTLHNLKDRSVASSRQCAAGIYQAEPLKNGWAELACPAAESWPVMKLPAKWQQRGLDFSGIIWFRHKIMLPEQWAGHDLELSLGAVDKTDITYFNEVKVGATGGLFDQSVYSRRRIYKVPGHLVKAGANVIAVRARSEFYDGGMTGPAEAMSLKCPDLPDSKPLELAGDWRYAVEHCLGLCSPNLPTQLFNGMVQPLMPLAFRGVIWYQGEDNQNNPELYQKLLSTLITDWRSRWGQGNFPFLIVQLANFRSPMEFQADSRWAVLREAQAQTAAALPNVDMITAIDIGEPGDVHPKNKQEVGRRLAVNALAEVYGKNVANGRGPIFKAVKLDGGSLRISFDNTEGCLKIAGTDKLKGFVIAGEDGKFYTANARIDGNTVILNSALVPAPCAARYDWADSPVGNLCNKYDLPAEPFRTDYKKITNKD